MLDSSSGGEAMEYVEGQHQIIGGLESELKKLKTGDKKSVTVAAAQAYGEYEPKLIMKVAKDQLPKDHTVKVGDQFRVDMQDQPRVMTVTEVQSGHVVLDGNHPLAGQDLYFDVEITGTRDATADDLKPHVCSGDHDHDHDH